MVTVSVEEPELGTLSGTAVMAEICSGPGVAVTVKLTVLLTELTESVAVYWKVSVCGAVPPGTFTVVDAVAGLTIVTVVPDVCAQLWVTVPVPPLTTAASVEDWPS